MSLRLRNRIIIGAVILSFVCRRVGGVSTENEPAVSLRIPGDEFSARQRERLRCRCCGLEGIDPQLLIALLRLQEKFGTLDISSGRRCASHNREVGGVEKSRHLRGQAADILVPAERQREFCALARQAGIRRILPSPARGYVHLSL